MECYNSSTEDKDECAEQIRETIKESCPYENACASKVSEKHVFISSSFLYHKTVGTKINLNH